MGLMSLSFPVITVGGTNGKGSVVAMLESVYLAAGYSVAAYTSPHLLHYRERVRLNGSGVADESLVAGFEHVDVACEGIKLTYFEYGTLAAIDIFRRNDVDVVILEVGLGGRLDAVNAFDSDVAVVTSVGIDHSEWLGTSRELIGREKAGIFRASRPAVCGDAEPPMSVRETARDLNTRFYLRGKDFTFSCDGGNCCFTGPDQRIENLPPPRLRGRVQLYNAATALMAVQCLEDRLPVTTDAMGQGLERVSLPGRYQQASVSPQILLDVAHNPDATRELAILLEDDATNGRTIAVVGMLADKALTDSLRPLINTVDVWHLADLPPPRGARADELADALKQLDPRSVLKKFNDIRSALSAAQKTAKPVDRIVVFGSFISVGVIMRELN
jgi:dihydrofolate synthase/folylpolyglutamate synthase